MEIREKKSPFGTRSHDGRVLADTCHRPFRRQTDPGHSADHTTYPLCFGIGHVSKTDRIIRCDTKQAKPSADGLLSPMEQNRSFSLPSRLIAICSKSIVNSNHVASMMKWICWPMIRTKANGKIVTNKAPSRPCKLKSCRKGRSLAK